MAQEEGSKVVRFAVLTVSDSRSAATDRSGDTLVQKIADAGHSLARRSLVRDDADAVETMLRQWMEDESVDVILSTGGTGITGRDVTPEAFRRVLNKELPGFGELFRMQSFATVGVSAMFSRALAGIAGGKYLFALPGSPGAVADAWDGILAAQFSRGETSCTLLQLMPRLRE